MIEWRITLSEPDFGEEETQAVAAVLRSRWLTMGTVTKAFEHEFAEYCGVKHAIAVSNGTAALHLAHWALGIGHGDEVICPSLTFVATANAILYCNATPVFADINSFDNLNISPEAIRQKITPATRCITVVHYAGYPCDMEAIKKIADENGLAVIEDACHAIGAEYEGKKCGTLGNIGCFSFFSNKNLVTGEGGMLVTDNAQLAQKLRLGRSHGMTTMTWDRHQGHASSYDVIDLGFNYRIDEMRAALGQVQLRKLEASNRRRQELTRRYQDNLAKLPELILPFRHLGANSSCHFFPVLLPPKIDRAHFMQQMKHRGIQTSVHYPPVHRFQYYQKHFHYATDSLPITEEVSRREVTLPLHPLMTLQDVDFVCEAVCEILSIEGEKI
ncbi:MAG: DegT/DnrJ/EryC1/StrS family aminotransferase [candidate division KSB1 bacterium]|nr:DegT/DnrJ/EryC1/StrS family aminotransferase [candidate division KSB1 bacterium]MDZ7301681.1 DegT/DnrJ/EryC1/StrS family aminotransferase [candidate division KSB1 bacterium]MDZ7312432.1 DegT/DnrJ/EryC1/StrS family aminotransferase [candidate division KSB1 bacterium]